MFVLLLVFDYLSMRSLVISLSLHNACIRVFSHLVICGDPSYETIKAIVQSFVHHDWAEANVGMVVINRSEQYRYRLTSRQCGVTICHKLLLMFVKNY